ncbi:MAG: O-antigen ligase family protein [Saprospiraceae bacterium]|nr:O-antigen ligase family protein [Saprospiraceae bacterium]
MQKYLLPVSSPTGLAFWSACLLVVSLPVSPFLLSVSMWLLVFAAWWHTAQTLQVSLRRAGAWWAVLRHSFGVLYRHRVYGALSLLLLAPALSFFWSDDSAYWLRNVQTRLPFLVLPWAFANFPPLEARQWKSVLYLFVWYIAAICVGVGIHFILHYDAIIEGLGRGNPVPVPRSHVRFSLITATAVLAGGGLWLQGFFLWRRWERSALGAVTLFLFVFLHVLSVRSGLFSLYAMMIFLLARYVWMSKRWLIGLATLVLMIGLFWTAVQTVPSLNRRYGYMMYDWERFVTHNEGHLYSDAARWISLRAGWRLWTENPVLGVGAGDLMREVKRVTAEQYPDYAQEPQLPHNQFLFIMAGTGLPGLLLSLAAFFTLWWAGRKNGMLTGLQVMAWASFLIECTLENAIGVAWFLFFTLWFFGSGTIKK